MLGPSSFSSAALDQPWVGSDDECERERIWRLYWVERKQPRMSFVKYWTQSELPFGLGLSLNASPGPNFGPLASANVWQINNFQYLGGASGRCDPGYIGSILRMLQLEVRFRLGWSSGFNTTTTIDTVALPPPPVITNGSNESFIDTSTGARWTLWLVYDRSGLCKQRNALPELGGLSGGVQGVLFGKQESACLAPEHVDGLCIIKKWSGTLDESHIFASVDDVVDLKGLPMGVSGVGNCFANLLDYGTLFMMAAYDTETYPAAASSDMKGWMSFAMHFADSNCSYERQF